MSEAESGQLPLGDVKVLDFAHLLPGELCSVILTDLGCRVTRIESLQPGLAHRLPPIVKGESLYYWSLHRNKRRIGLDLKNPDGVRVVHKLCESADVVIENFRPGVMDRLGIGYDDLAKVNPRLVYCSISGYGQTSAWSQRPGHDLNYVAESGILSLNRPPDGSPVVPGVLISDYMAGLYAALQVVTALHERQRTGLGKRLDVSMFESALSTLNVLATMLLYTGQQPAQSGFSYKAELPNYNIYECADGRHLAVASLEPKFWETFCERIGRPELGGHSPTGPDKALRDELAAIIASRPLAEWVEVFEGSDCCVSPVHTLEEAIAYLPSRERGVITHIVHPVLGKVPQMATPVFAKAAAADAPSLDSAEETRRVLRELGYSGEAIEELALAGAIAGQ